MKTMTESQRETYAKLILALARDDREEIVRLHFGEMGALTRRKDPRIAYLFCTFYNDRNTPDICGDMNISQFIDWLQAQDPMVRVPEDYIFASRLSVLLRGMGNAFGVQMRMSKMWEQDAKKFLERREDAFRKDSISKGKA